MAVVPLQHSIQTKHTQTNYLVWKLQVIPYLESQKLLGYVDGSIPPPPRTITDSSSNLVPNPAFRQWRQQDQMILSVLLSSLTESILTQVVGNSTSRALWEALEKNFKAKSQGHIMQLRVNLATFKKGSLSLIDYFQKMKEFVDTLAAVDKPLTDCEVVSYILVGLSSEYDSFVTTVTTRIDPILLEDLYGHLLTFESRMEANNPAADVGFPSANFVTKTNNNRGSGSSNYNSGRGNSYSSRSRGRGVAVAVDLHKISSLSPQMLGLCVKSVAKVDTQHSSVIVVSITRFRVMKPTLWQLTWWHHPANRICLGIQIRLPPIT
jgi:hypothetical protein